MKLFRRRPRVNDWLDFDFESIQYRDGRPYMVGAHGKWWRRATDAEYRSAVDR